MFSATIIVKTGDEEKMCSYSGYGIVISFDSAGSWNFENDFARNVLFFGFDNNLLSLADNRKNNFLVSSQKWRPNLNVRLGSPEKHFLLILVNKQIILLEFAL